MILKAPQFHSFTVSQNGMGGGVRNVWGGGVFGYGGVGRNSVVSGSWLVVRTAGSEGTSEGVNERMSDEVSRGRGNGKAAFSSQFPALRAEAAFVAPAFPWSLA